MPFLVRLCVVSVLAIAVAQVFSGHSKHLSPKHLHNILSLAKGIQVPRRTVTESRGTKRNFVQPHELSPILERLYAQKAEAMNRARFIDEEIRQVLQNTEAETRSLTKVHGIKSPSFLGTRRWAPIGTGEFGAEGGKMVLGPAHAGDIGGMMAGKDSIFVRSNTKQTATANKKSVLVQDHSHATVRKAKPVPSPHRHQSAAKKGIPLGDAFRPPNRPPNKISNSDQNLGHRKSGLFGTYEQSFILYPDSNKVVALPNPAAMHPAYPNLIMDTPAVSPSSIAQQPPVASYPENIPNVAMTTSTGSYPATLNGGAPVPQSTMVYQDQPPGGAIGSPTDMVATVGRPLSNRCSSSDVLCDHVTQEAQINVKINTTEAALGNQTVDADDNEDDQFNDDENISVLGDPKKFNEKCTVLKLTFEHSQGGVVFDDSIEGNDAELEQGAFVSDETAKSGLAMNLGQQGFLKLADKFKGKPRRSVAVSMWVKLDDTNGYNPLLRAIGDDDITHYELAVNNSKGLWVHRDDNGAVVFQVESNGTKGLTPGSWHHILGSFNGREGNASLWVDGKATGSQSGVTGSLSRHWNMVKMFEGKTSGIVDNVFMFRCPMDRTKIVALYVAAASPKDKKVLIPRPRKHH
ncbi:uncharacterized protein LOC116619522 [Nematostella vectensis]|uniref:uncharacterized protein LOC116619522 n=1 Tax=Nematostella vectensis TaxID=45351 RepID=UPI0020774035|nr:uncharacterized protein LOC116619522 [Nematostella vectensis]